MHDSSASRWIKWLTSDSGVFSGIAQLTSGLKMEDIKLWSETTRWRGHFWIRWLVIRDVPNGDLRNISCKMNDNMPVTRSRDSQELEYDVSSAQHHRQCPAD